MADVVDLPVITSLDLEPDQVLQKAIEANLTDVVICGYDANGDEYFASSLADGAEVLWILQRSSKSLLEMADEMTDDDDG